MITFLVLLNAFFQGPTNTTNETAALKTTWDEVVVLRGIRNNYTVKTPPILNGKPLSPDDYELTLKSSTFGFFNHPGSTWNLSLSEQVYLEHRLKNSALHIQFTGPEDRWWPYSASKTYVITIAIPSECDKVMQLFFTEWNSLVSSKLEIEKTTDISISMSDLFSNLKDSEFNNYLKRLPDTNKLENIDCIKVVELLKFIDSNSLYGFETKEYKLTDEIKSFLDNWTEILMSPLSRYTMNEIVLKCIGYADSRNIQKHVPVPNAIKCFYDRKSCSENFLTRKLQFFALDTSREYAGRITVLENNCQLSALRAFSTMKYFKERMQILERYEVNKHKSHPKMSETHFHYAAGGAIIGRNSEDNEKNRRIEIELFFRGLKELEKN